MNSQLDRRLNSIESSLAALVFPFIASVCSIRFLPYLKTQSCSAFGPRCLQPYRIRSENFLAAPLVPLRAQHEHMFLPYVMITAESTLAQLEAGALHLVWSCPSVRGPRLCLNCVRPFRQRNPTVSMQGQCLAYSIRQTRHCRPTH